MSTLLTFIIPVRHQDNARDWGLLKANLTQTIASIANQRHSDWRCVIVANEGADLPTMPEKFSVERVDFPPNDLHELSRAGDREVFYDAFRVDKGRRVLSGMLSARDSRFFMIVDDDDFVSARIVDHVADHPDANGWTISKGYLWGDGGRLLLENDHFDHLCGTCLIVRSDMYDLPMTFELAEIDWIKTMLGSHVRIAGLLAERGTPLAPLPFRGAIYRVGNPGSHSRAPGILQQYFLSRDARSRPRETIRQLRRLRLLGTAQRREFFG